MDEALFGTVADGRGCVPLRHGRVLGVLKDEMDVDGVVVYELISR